MKRIKFIQLSVVFTFALALSAYAGQLSPRYIFLFIGDGMSVPQRMVAEELAVTSGYGPLAINHMPHQAVTITRSASSIITDSAAAGTAIACGEKTANGRIGLDAAGTRRLTSVAETAKRAGRKVGIITTVPLNHATPAAFYGHQLKRSMGYQLGLDLVASGFDYFAGGGLSGASDTKAPGYCGKICDLAKAKGYVVTREAASFRALKPGAGKVLAPLYPASFPYALDRESTDELTLADLVAKGIELMDGPEGFFMMAEGGKIDWKCHANDAGTMAYETIDFDRAVKVAMAFADKHPDETLIVVTGDHETGGLTMGFADTKYNCYIEQLAHQKCSGDVFTQKLKDIKTQAEFREAVAKFFGLDFSGSVSSPLTLKPEEIAALDTAFAERNKLAENEKSATFGNESSRLASRVIQLFNNKCGLAWTTTSHTALPVETSARGVGANKFTGHIDNTDIARILSAMIKATAGKTIVCEGTYDAHLQGVATDGESIFWPFTKTIVKTDLKGKVLASVRQVRHQGDCCVKDGLLYVAVNLGHFNTENQAVSEVWAYDTKNLELKKKWRTPELVHGAGGITWKGDKFYVVGGLPETHTKNYVYEYTSNFEFVKRHELKTGYTVRGIQTATFVQGKFIFGCYSSPQYPIRTLICPETLDSFKVANEKTDVGSLELNGRIFRAQTSRKGDKSWNGRLIAATEL